VTIASNRDPRRAQIPNDNPPAAHPPRRIDRANEEPATPSQQVENIRAGTRQT